MSKDLFYKMMQGELDDDQICQLIMSTSNRDRSRWLKSYMGKDYHYMATFTIDPNRHDVKNSDLHKDIENYVKKGIKNLKVKEAWIVKEGGDDEHKHTHWHVSILSEKPLKKSRMAYYKVKYGNYDWSPSRNGNNVEALNYMSKQSTPVRL